MVRLTADAVPLVSSFLPLMKQAAAKDDAPSDWRSYSGSL